MEHIFCPEWVCLDFWVCLVLHDIANLFLLNLNVVESKLTLD